MLEDDGGDRLKYKGVLIERVGNRSSKASSL